MQQALITQRDSSEISGVSEKGCITTFRECLKSSEGRGLYHKKVFFLMVAYSIFASFFLALPFFLFKKPIYCEMITQQQTECCLEQDQQCEDRICSIYISDIRMHVKPEDSLTFLFGLFCNKEWIRFVYKVFPQTLSIIGFLLYGMLSDVKGRKVSMKIAWRMYTVGIIIFTMAQAQFLKTFGYLLASVHCFPALINQFVLFFELNTKKQKNRESLLLLACISVGPLFLSISSQIITQIDNRIVLGVLCAVPATILSLFVDKIFQSPVCVYPTSKQKAFGLVNLIAKQNKKLPILIDLSRSFWHKQIFPKINYMYLMKKKPINTKMFLGLFFLFTVTLSIKTSQISLDDYTSTHYRSILVNIPTVLADLTLCIFLLKIKRRSCRIMLIVTIALIISLLACREANLSQETMKVITIIHAVLIRYACQLCDGLVLIWAIETFPTICRGHCVGFIFCGSSLGVIVAYFLREYIQIAYVIMLLSATFAIVFQGHLKLDKFGIMKDTMQDGYYDEHDSFYRS